MSPDRRLPPFLPPFLPAFHLLLPIGLAAVSLAAGCAGSEARDPGAPPEATAPTTKPAPATRSAAGGSIAGRIAYDAGPAPAMRICAIGSGDPADAAARCVRTAAGATAYRIDGLGDDDYNVFAWTTTSPPRVGGHVRQVQCIRAPCPPMPESVTVAGGARVDGVDLDGFYDRREDFPPPPAE